ncbi:hypothetical protein ATY31_20375 [Sinorhizobium americanum]|uniref:Uncharacterized protein n=1 Tax=Sinorhizobium americanum TaxID=194963 RepID=A0A2S3YJC5_9HYPH|nr:hypothetical protein ATY31_20375 [Sinorhizobium americanum]
MPCLKKSTKKHRKTGGQTRVMSDDQVGGAISVPNALMSMSCPATISSVMPVSLVISPGMEMLGCRKPP